jgi:hypothetical protein
VLDPASPLFLSSEPPPMSFVKLSIFGTSFEVGFLLLFLHLSHPISGHHKICRSPTRWHGCVIHIHSIPPLDPAHPLQGAFGLVWYVHESSFPHPTNALPSSAKDQLTGASVAIKKIMKPFSTPVLSKRTYRELKLLKHIQHENVRLL